MFDHETKDGPCKAIERFTPERGLVAGEVHVVRAAASGTDAAADAARQNEQNE